MSQIGVGTVLVPLIVVLALHATRRHRDTGGRAARAGGGDEGERDPGAATAAGIGAGR